MVLNTFWQLPGYCPQAGFAIRRFHDPFVFRADPDPSIIERGPNRTIPGRITIDPSDHYQKERNKLLSNWGPRARRD